jgi:hypothetical protein
VAATASTGELDLSHETQLVKAAVLYADHVTLASPKAVLLASVAAFGRGDRRARIGEMTELLSALEGGKEATELYNQLRRRRNLSPQERFALKAIEGGLGAGTKEVTAKVDEILEGAGAGELALAISAGLLDIHTLGLEGAKPDSFADTVVQAIAAVLRDSLSASAQTFPMFDDGAGNLLRAIVNEGKLADPHRSRAAEAGIAGRLIAGLEAFPNAEMDVILDVRLRLQAPLARFRSALARASAEFDAAAWDEGFAREVDDLYRREVAPALLEVEEALKELGVRPTLLRVAAGKEALVAAATATLGLAAAGGAAPGDLPHLLFSATALGGVASAAGEARERRKVQGEVEHNAFYFLYQAGQYLDE